MNKLLLLFVLIWCQISFSQGQREKIKSFKIAYITEQLDLSSKEAQKFWPIYNEYEQQIGAQKQRERKVLRTLQDTEDASQLDDATSQNLISTILESEEEKFKARKILISKLQKIISDQKILTLLKAETDFNKRLLKQLRERRRG